MAPDFVDRIEAQGLVDMERGAKVSGSRFGFVTGDLVLLELALVRWAMDVLAPGMGEIVGGSQREERLDVLDRRIEGMGLIDSLFSGYKWLPKGWRDRDK